ncbi:2-Acylglycerol O-Acyltransferase 3 [Manis pentadactyla]|nr:2-Acylglycerol O-Acyltransferase 3 [Manis pentadactyla]
MCLRYHRIPCTIPLHSMPASSSRLHRGLQVFTILQWIFFLGLGLVSSDKASTAYLLSRPGGGQVAVLAVGGPLEALKTKPGVLSLRIRTQKGFIKLALEHGASLVPVFSFGENELFQQFPNPPGSWGRRAQEVMQPLLRVALPRCSTAAGASSCPSVRPSTQSALSSPSFFCFSSSPRSGCFLFSTRCGCSWTGTHPSKLVKTGELPPNRNYVLVSHPHGIMSTGTFCNFSTECNGTSQMFPGIRLSVARLTSLFYYPVLRNYILWSGLCSVARQSLDFILSRPQLGQAVVILVGGAQESLYAIQGQHYLTLQNHKGFVRLALRHGASLVPVYNFGENDIFRLKAFATDSWQYLC